MTSKLKNVAHAHDDALAAFDETLRTLDVGYVDLFLVAHRQGWCAGRPDDHRDRGAGRPDTFDRVP